MKIKQKIFDSKTKTKDASKIHNKLEEKIKHPIFCFKYLHKDYNLSKCENDEKIYFLEKLVKLSNLSWQEIEYTGRHQLGSEKISRNAIKQNIHSDIADNIDFYLALRFYGKKAFIGYRDKFIFHILFIDRDFTLYKH